MKDASKPCRCAVNWSRVTCCAILLLSLFIVAKSFIAVGNIEVWSDDLRRTFLNDLATQREQREGIAYYERRIDAIQKQWAVLRFVGLGLTLLSVGGILLATKAGKTGACPPDGAP